MNDHSGSNQCFCKGVLTNQQNIKVMLMVSPFHLCHVVQQPFVDCQCHVVPIRF